MCSVGAVIIGASALSAYGQYKQGQDDADTLEAQAATERMKARDARERGYADESRVRTETSQEVAEAKTAFAQTDFDISSGSPLDALLDIRMVGDLDATTARNDAWRAAWGMERQGETYREAARRRRQNSYLSATSTFIGGAASAYSRGAPRESTRETT